MDDVGRVRVAEMILEIRELQVRLRQLAIDKSTLEGRNSLEFVVDDLESAIEHLLRAVVERR